MQHVTTVITASTVEPITLADAKLHLRVTGSAEDTLITSIVKASRQRLELATRRTLCTQTLRAVFPRFPERCDPWPERLILGSPPVQAVTSIAYIDTTGESQTWASDRWLLMTDEPAWIEPVYGVCWPSTRRQSNAVTVTYTAGYGDAAAVPELIKAAMRLMVGHLYMNREEVVLGLTATALPSGVQTLISSLRWGFEV